MDPGTFPSFLLSYFVQLVPSPVESRTTTWCSFSSSLLALLIPHLPPLWHHAILQTNVLVIRPIPCQRISTVLIRYTFRLRRVPYLHVGPTEMAGLRGSCASSRAGPLRSSHISDRVAYWLVWNWNYGSCHTHVLPLVADTGDHPNPTIPTSPSPRLSLSSGWIWFLGEIEPLSWKPPERLLWGNIAEVEFGLWFYFVNMI